MLPLVLVALILGVVAYAVLGRASSPRGPAHLKPFHSLPGPVAWPFLGSAFPLLTAKKPSAVLAAWASKYGTFFRVGLPGGKAAVVVTSPALIAEAAALPVAGPAAAARAALVGGEAALPPAAHAALASSLGSADAAAAAAFPATADAAGRLVRALCAAGPNAPVDIADGLDRACLDAAVAGGFALQAGGLGDGSSAAFGRCDLLADLRSAVAALGPLAAFGVTKPGFAAAAAPLHAHWRSMAAVVKGRGPPGKGDASVGAALARAGLSEADLSAAIGAAVAASLPTARAAAHVLVDLAHEQGVADKVARELGEAGLLAHGEDREPRGVAAADVAGRLPYLGAVVRESLRLHGVSPPGLGPVGLVRQVTAPGGAALGGVHLPAGTLVAAPPSAVHAAAANYANPTRFSPDRWLEPVKPHTPKVVTEKPGPVLLVGKPREHGGAPGSAVAFGAGAGACPAQAAAVQQVTALVATLVSNFRMRLDDSMGGRKGLDAAGSEDAAGAVAGFGAGAGGLRMVFVPRASIGFSANV